MKQSIHFKLLVSLLTASFCFSCVPNKKITLLQHTTAEKDELLPNEQKARKYETGTSDYLLNPNDLLDIKISTMTPSAFNPFNDADRSIVPGMTYGGNYSGEVVQQQGYYIDPAGWLDLPILGMIQVGGLTIPQAEDSIAVKVKKYLDRPVVRLKLLNFRFSVMGEVEREGTLFANDNNITLLQGLAMAGGASEFGDLSKVKIIRHAGDNTYVFYVDLLTEEFLSSPFSYVQPNDVIVVPPLKQRSFLKYMSPNISLLATTVSLVISVLALLSIK